MSTDTGHNSISPDGSWAVNKESLTDWGYRAMHGSVVLAKEAIEAYYSSAPRYNYFSGCSTGGRQGLKEVELYPEDFNGVLAGAPAWYTSHLQPVSTCPYSFDHRQIANIVGSVDGQGRAQ
jgi:feruloyl esterase